MVSAWEQTLPLWYNIRQESLGTPWLHKEVAIVLCGEKEELSILIKKKKKSFCLEELCAALHSDSLQLPELEIASHAA